MTVPAQSQVTAWVACEQCDALHQPSALAPGTRAHCHRCGATLGAAINEKDDVSLALALAGIVLLVVAHANPVFGIEVKGQTQTASLLQAAYTLYLEDAWILSLLVLTTTLVFPALELFAIGYILIPLRQGLIAPGYARVLRLMQAVRPWVMVEVFMLGVLIALVKLAAMASILPGVGLGAFVAVMLVLAGIDARLDHRALWGQLVAPG